MWLWFHKLSTARYFYTFAATLTPWLGWLAGITIVIGLYLGLVVAPIDYQQKDAYRIMFVHVPAAWMSMMIYTMMAVSGAIGLIWRIKLAHVACTAAATIGASFTLITLVSGSIWGKPMWGAWWAWDARLTSELILLFLYLGFIALQSAIPDQNKAQKAGAILLLAGVVNVPIIHYSVLWWHTLHQNPSVSKFGAPSIHTSMLIPLLVMTVGFLLLFLVLLAVRMRAMILESEYKSKWLRQLEEGR